VGNNISLYSTRVAVDLQQQPDEKGWDSWRWYEPDNAMHVLGLQDFPVDAVPRSPAPNDSEVGMTTHNQAHEQLEGMGQAQHRLTASLLQVHDCCDDDGAFAH
jgi:hypothetical protein